MAGWTIVLPLLFVAGLVATYPKRNEDGINSPSESRRDWGMNYAGEPQDITYQDGATGDDEAIDDDHDEDDDDDEDDHDVDEDAHSYSDGATGDDEAIDDDHDEDDDDDEDGDDDEDAHSYSAPPGETGSNRTLIICVVVLVVVLMLFIFGCWYIKFYKR